MRLDILVPVFVYCVWLWWIGRRVGRTRFVLAAIVTLLVIFVVIIAERGLPK